MKSLRKLLLSRFIIIVIAHTLIVLLAVYGITFLNIRNSIDWDLKRLQQRLIDCIEEKGDRQQFEALVDSLNLGEERQFEFAVFEDGQLVFGDSITKPAQETDLKIDFHSYKEWSFEKISQKDNTMYLTSIRADLDLIQSQSRHSQNCFLCTLQAVYMIA